MLEVFETDQEILIVTEYAKRGDLLQYIKERGILEEDKARKIFRQITIGLGHIHS